MDAVATGVIIFCTVIIIGGLVIAHYGNKASEKIQQKELKNKK